MLFPTQLYVILWDLFVLIVYKNLSFAHPYRTFLGMILVNSIDGRYDNLKARKMYFFESWQLWFS
jgi:hypothetical protein